MKKYFLLFFLIVNIAICKGQNITFTEISIGINDLDAFIELLTKKEFILSEKREEKKGIIYSMVYSKEYKYFNKTCPFWVHVCRGNSENFIELQFGDDHKSIFMNFLASLKKTCKKTNFRQEDYCNCFITTYESNGIVYEYFEKFTREGILAYHLTAKKYL